MLIVLEGTDLSGKSTFIDFLRRYMPDLHVIHSVAPKRGQDPYVQYEHAIEKAQNEHEHVICDRLHWSEPVYAQVSKRKDRLGVAGFRHIELFLARRSAQVVYFQPPEHELRRRYALRGDEHVTLDQVLQAHDLYPTVAEQSILPMLNVVQGSVSLARFVHDRGVLYLKNDRLHRVFDPCYVGRPQPTVLLLGERRKETRDHSAFVPRGSTSGRWLLEALPDPLWRHVGITNACELDRLELEDVHQRLGEPPIVTLGRAAHEATAYAGLPHSAVPHPQYIRRFLHGKLDAYGQLIEDVIGLNEDHLKWKGET